MSGVALLPRSRRHLILVLSFAPDPLLISRATADLLSAGKTVNSIALYPYTHMASAVLSDPQNENVFSVTIVSQDSGTGTPFSVLCVIDSYGTKNVSTLVGLLRQPLGLVLQGTVSVSTMDQGRQSLRTVPIKYVVQNLAISSLTQ